MRNTHSLQFGRHPKEWRPISNYWHCRARKQNCYMLLIYRGNFQNPIDCRRFTIRNTHAVPHTKLRKYMRDFKLVPRSRWELRSSGSLRSEYRSHLQRPKVLMETSVRNFQYSLRNNLEEWRSPKFDEAIRRQFKKTSSDITLSIY
jgi:hypothetical protein